MKDDEIAAGGAVDISQLKALADKAGTEVVQVELYEEGWGLPASIPVLLDRTSGTTRDLRPLFEAWRFVPERRSGTARALTLDSFIELTNRHKLPPSAIFADSDWRAPSLTAVIDYHEASAAGGAADNCKHRIHYDFPLSEEWKAWIAQDGQPMGQGDFAQWIEDHITELAAPDAADSEEILKTFGFKAAFPNELQMLSRGLQVHAETLVKSNVTLQSGEGEITFAEEHRDASGNKLAVPGMFLLSISPFFMGERARIPVRLRYRVRGGAITWSFHIYRPDVHITEQLRRDMEAAATACELPVYEGAPEA
ncbi:DUF2303 family protein [Martelella soudanensis]|uniref:DUF2303 family protein n=1 Tax=unclassified Martelella TaxID=2629616 RepID=UPI0015E0514C|nr:MULTISPECIES: DUF2303 family protein [unclassified Martelella]